MNKCIQFALSLCTERKYKVIQVDTDTVEFRDFFLSIVGLMLKLEPSWCPQCNRHMMHSDNHTVLILSEYFVSIVYCSLCRSATLESVV